MEVNTEVRQALFQSVSRLSDEEINKVVEGGKWTIAQVLEHLYLMETVVTKTIVAELENEQSQPASTKPIHRVPDRSFKVEAPSYVVPSDRFIGLQESLEKLKRSREALENIVGDVEEVVLEQKSYRHPVLGPLNIKQWVSFVGLHEKRHLYQIEEIKEQL
ncbi:DinB family protein [Alkalihalobacillus sp. LMS39]|uniref:DinB family protein n=1 Tax=Alkalihalobacillus sp. LMS39 TaxID=2924032 RepID=UPI001FB28B38|nr:DinB family protein [Alkalihalobacillus sp. LMS39]UOE95346.1 DinB family protein [Alkalihalobacillus sp. LMS39]